jgi:crotonobetainyl-CoA:carnitine CoA-transferase CaiB-like acyl-CoA transferase
MTMACAGVTVVDLTRGMVALAGMILADNGAEVIKIEPPGGDWARDEPGFLMWNRGKRSVVLDLTREADRAVAVGLAERADVVIESFRPGVAERLGLGYEELAARNPGLVYCSISGYGRTEELSGRKGYEGAVAAKLGRMIGLDRISGAVPGQDREYPIYTAAPVASYGASQLAVQGIVSALLARGTIGRGQKVETSLLQASACFLMRGLARDDGRIVAAPTLPTIRRGIELCFLTAECSDGKYVQMCARQDHHFRDWMKAIGLAEVLEDPTYAKAPLGIARLEDIEALEERIREKMLQKPQAEWMRLFIEEYDVGADPFLTPEEFLAHSQMVLNGRVVEIEDPTVGRTKQVGPLVLFSKTPSQIGRPAPRLDEHGAEIRARAAYANGAPKIAPANGAGPPARRPLAGVTILEVAYFLAGPFSTTILADMGARVIKVEPLDGDPFRRTGLGFSKMVHGKESIALNLKSEAGIRILHQLVERADALIHSFRPGVPERLRMDYATLSALNPRLVYLYGGSYGSKGPQSHRAAMHSTPHALNGGGFLQAGAGNPPADDSYPDPGSGLGAGTALLLGLLARERIGEGQAMETTMLCSSGYVLSGDLVLYEGMPPRRIVDRGQHGLEALARLYLCQTGWIFLVVRQEKEWPRLAKAIDRPDLIEDPRFATRADRLRHDAELTDILAPIFRTRPAEEWERILTAVDVAASRADRESFPEFLLHQGLLIPMEHPDFGKYWHTPFTVDFSAAPNVIAPAAGIGEFTRPLLAELGYGPADVDRLFAKNIVR